MAEQIEFPRIDPEEPMAKAESAMRAVKLWKTDAGGGEANVEKRVDANGNEIKKSEMVLLGEKVAGEFDSMRAGFVSDGKISFLQSEIGDDEPRKLAKLLLAKQLASESDLMVDEKAGEMLAIVERQPGILDDAFVKEIEDKLVGVEGGEKNLISVVNKFLEGEDKKIVGIGENQRKLLEEMSYRNPDGRLAVLNGLISGVDIARETGREKPMRLVRGVEINAGEMNNLEVLRQIGEAVNTIKLVTEYKGIVLGVAWEATQNEIKKIKESGVGDESEVYKKFVDIVTPVIGEYTAEEFKVKQGDPLVNVLQNIVIDKLENGAAKQIWEARSAEIVKVRAEEETRLVNEEKAKRLREENDRNEREKVLREEREKIQIEKWAVGEFMECKDLKLLIKSLLEMNPKNSSENSMLLLRSLEEKKYSSHIKDFARSVMRELGDMIDGREGSLARIVPKDRSITSGVGEANKNPLTAYTAELNMPEIARVLGELLKEDEGEFDYNRKAKIEAIQILVKDKLDSMRTDKVV